MSAADDRRESGPLVEPDPRVAPRLDDLAAVIEFVGADRSASALVTAVSAPDLLTTVGLLYTQIDKWQQVGEFVRRVQEIGGEYERWNEIGARAARWVRGAGSNWP